MYENIKIFEGLTSSDINTINPIVRNYRKDSYIVIEGETVKFIGVVLTGTIEVFKNTYNGNRILILSGSEDFVFGESISILGQTSYPVSVKAISDCKVLLINSDQITNCKNERFLMNIMKIIANTCIQYRKKITILEQHSTREKLLTYLLYEANKNNSQSFDIPYDRQALADYLGVDRSAMSSEIGKLVREHLLTTKKNHFELL